MIEPRRNETNPLRQQQFPAADNAWRTAVAPAGLVNRTHRIIRQEALNLRAQRSQRRSLWLPLTIFSVLMLGICYAIWGLMAGYDVSGNGIPDASDQLMLLLLWSLPVTVSVLAVVWLRRGRARAGSREVIR